MSLAVRIVYAFLAMRKDEPLSVVCDPERFQRFIRDTAFVVKKGPD